MCYSCEKNQTKMVLELRRNIFTWKFTELIYLPQCYKTWVFVWIEIATSVTFCESNRLLMLLDDTSDQGWDSSGDHKLPGVHFSDNINGLLIFDDRCTLPNVMHRTTDFDMSIKFFVFIGLLYLFYCFIVLLYYWNDHVFCDFLKFMNRFCLGQSTFTQIWYSCFKPRRLTKKVWSTNFLSVLFNKYR